MLTIRARLAARASAFTSPSRGSSEPTLSVVERDHLGRHAQRCAAAKVLDPVCSLTGPTVGAALLAAAVEPLARHEVEEVLP